MKEFINKLFYHNNEPPFKEVDYDAFIKIRTGKSFLTANKYNTYLELGDINTYVPNHGDGTALMNALIDYAKKNNYKKITGWISKYDLDHIERIKHFYSKFGFEIKKSYNSQKPIEKYTIELLL